MVNDVKRAYALALVEAYLRRLGIASKALIACLYDALDESLAYFYRKEAVKLLTDNTRVKVDLITNTATL